MPKEICSPKTYEATCECCNTGLVGRYGEYGTRQLKAVFNMATKSEPGPSCLDRSAVQEPRER